jgi:hypothetical protein
MTIDSLVENGMKIKDTATTVADKKGKISHYYWVLLNTAVIPQKQM